jgi:hypothetical protein
MGSVKITLVLTMSPVRTEQGIRAEVTGSLHFENGRGYFIALKPAGKAKEEMRVWLRAAEDKVLVRQLQTHPFGGIKEKRKPMMLFLLGLLDCKAVAKVNTERWYTGPDIRWHLHQLPLGDHFLPLQPWPTEFAAPEGSMLLFVTLKREKK